MTYDDWKTRAPDPEEKPCGCVWDYENGRRFLVERCESHEFLYQQEEERRRKADEMRALTEREDADDDIPF